MQQDIDEFTAAAVESGDPRLMAMAFELNQRLYEYLDDLEIIDHKIDACVFVKIEGKTIKFRTIEDVAEWITSNR